MRSIAPFLLAAGMAAASPAAAQDDPVVVELFTSQGCSACPPADALIGDLAAWDNVIALALHVDYWDYIGWADTFAEPGFTARQHGYGHAAGSTVVYTPQMIVGGADVVMGYDPMRVVDLIAAQQVAPDPLAITVTRAGPAFLVEAQRRPGAGATGTLEVHLVSFLPHAEVAIARGENAGRTSEHYNVVRSWYVVARWEGADTFETRIVPETDMPHVVLFQAPNHGAIQGAARLD